MIRSDVELYPYRPSFYNDIIELTKYARTIPVNEFQRGESVSEKWIDRIKRTEGMCDNIRRNHIDPNYQSKLWSIVQEKIIQQAQRGGTSASIHTAREVKPYATEWPHVVISALSLKFQVYPSGLDSVMFYWKV